MALPNVALVIGDPAGVGPEIVAKALSNEKNRRLANIFIIADEAEVKKGMAIANQSFPYEVVQSFSQADFRPGIPVLMDFPNRNAPFQYGKATEQSGKYMIDTLGVAVDLSLAGKTQAICFAPLNKQAMHLGGLKFRDELHWFASLTDCKTFCCEMNVVNGIWAGRVTSHIPFRDIVSNLSVERIVEAIELMHRTLKWAGFDEPRIAVQALNPHAGENGLFGEEEITIIKPAMEIARQKGIKVYGPYPGDTTIRSMEKEKDKLHAIVSMYHDQASTALKLLGFETGVTVQGGIPIPITTANHGTAYDLYGKNLATPKAFETAFELAAKMGASK